MATAESDGRGALLRPLRNRNFVLVCLGQTVSSLGDSMYLVALPWSVYRVTGSSADMGMILAVNVIPRLLLTLFGGAVADRWSRRATIVACNTAAGMVTATAALLLRVHEMTLGGFLIVAFVLGMVTAFFNPAYAPIYRGIVPVEDLQAASALESGAANTASVAGPLLAALLLSGNGGWIVFAIEAATFFIAAGSAAAAAIHQEKVAYRATLLREVASGLKLVLATRWLRTVILISLLANLMCVAPMFVLLPTVTAQPGGRGSLLSLAVAVQFASSLLFALLVGKYGHLVPRGAAIYLLAGAIGAGVALLGLGARAHVLIVPAEVIIGLGFAFNIVENTMLAELVPQAFLSRVYSIVILSSMALTPVGYAAAGFLARIVGAREVLVTGGACFAAVCLLGAALGRSRLLGPDVQGEAAPLTAAAPADQPTNAR